MDGCMDGWTDRWTPGVGAPLPSTRTQNPGQISTLASAAQEEALMQEGGTLPLSSPHGGVTPLLGSARGPCAPNLSLSGQLPPPPWAPLPLPGLSGRGL